MLRKLAVSLAVAGVLSATQANALGLGQIRIKSALNEPLDAEIQLLQVRDLDPQQIQPQMADVDQFAIAGLDRTRLLSNVKFQVDVRPNGTGVIHLTSSQPVREPFINLLVEVNWPNGRLVREYTVLLDPPVFEAAPVAGAVQPVQAPVTVAPTQPARGQFASRRPSGPVDNIRTRVTDNQVWVQTQDTLGELARRHSPGGGTTLNQMMLALQRKNPHAFPNNNINFLKAGVVLDLPTLEEVRSMSPAAANSEVSRQMQAWKTGRSSAAAPSAPSAPQTDGSKKKPVAPSESDAEAAPASQDQLKILAAVDGEQAKEEAGAQETASSTTSNPDTEELLQRNEALENQLAVTQESVDRVERENAELDEKLTAITQQLETLQRLLELKDQQMAALQDQLQQAQTAPPPPVAPPPPKEPTGIIETLMASPAYMAGIGAVVGGLLVALLGFTRRRKDDTQPYNPDESRPGSAIAGTAAAAAVAGAAMTEAADDDDEPTAALVAAGTGTTVAETDSELDLDMDLDLDLPLDHAAAEAEAEAEAEQEAGQPVEALDDDEFDLTLDGAFEDDGLPNDQVGEIATDEEAEEFDLSFDEDFQDELPEPDEVVVEDIDESLDDILGEAMGEEEEAELAALRSGMDQLEEVEGFEDDEPEETLESLGLDSVLKSGEASTEPEEELIEFSAREDDDDEKEVRRSAEEEEDYRLSLVAPIIPDDDDELDEAAPTTPDVDEAVADGGDVAAAADEASFEFADKAAEPDGDESPELSPPAPAFEFDDDRKASADAEATTEADEETDLESILAESGLELTLEDEPEEGAATEEAGSDEPPAGAADAINESTGFADAEEERPDLHPELEGLVEGEDGDQDEDAISVDETASDDSDLDAMLAALSKDFHDTGAGDEAESVALSEAEEEHDESDLDTELETLLGSVDDEIALDETGAEDEDLGMEGLEFLDGTDEVETKLDLARAYIDMEDRDGAKDILSEILQEGSNKQQQEARKLMETLT